MKTNLLKTGTRVAATLVGVVGMLLIWSSLFFLKSTFTSLSPVLGSSDIGTSFVTGFVVMSIVEFFLGVYFLSTCRRVWFKLSPKAAQRLSISLAWCIWGISLLLADHFVVPMESPWFSAVGLFSGILVFWLYLFVRDALTAALFGRQTQPA